MRIERRSWDGTDADALAAEIRSAQPESVDVGETVAEIISKVESGGDAAVGEIAERLGEPTSRQLRIGEEGIAAARESLDPEITAALELAAANIRAVAEAQLAEEQVVELEQGHSVRLGESPVEAAGVYAPGGIAAYPSTVLMCCVPAHASGVERIAVATPPGPGGSVPPAILAAAGIADADEVYAIGGAQAIAALALGTETVTPVDVIAGPGNAYVQEAKRQLYGRVGIDGIAGPSELMVIAGEMANPDWIALDLCAQAEHADDSLLACAAVESGLLDRIEARVQDLAAEHASVADAPLFLVELPDTDTGIELANALAPEHLELAADDAEMLARGVRTAGCVLIGDSAATAFGDYVAGSNHVLPTGGAGRFQGPLGPAAFRRRTAAVQVGPDAAAALAGPAATLAQAEGFPVHGESAQARGR